MRTSPSVAISSHPTLCFLSQAIEILHRNERGRQGKGRAQMVKELREEERRRKMYDASSHLDLDPESAAAEIQRIFRGTSIDNYIWYRCMENICGSQRGRREEMGAERSACVEEVAVATTRVVVPPPLTPCLASFPPGLSVRSQTRGERHDELVFVGMKAPKMYNEALEREMALGYKKRKQEQAYNRDAYLKDLTELRVRGHCRRWKRGGRRDCWRFLSYIIRCRSQYT